MQPSDTRTQLDALTLGERLRRLRNQAGLTQQELAENAGLSVRAVSDLERGVRRLPYRDTLQRLADALDLAADARAVLLAARRQTVPATERLDGAATRMPVPLSSFVGREQELADLRRQLRKTRLLTLVGVGGVGKTRLALRVAADVQSEYADGVGFVALAPLSDQGLVAQAVAVATGVREQPQRSLLEVLREALHGRELLLILDNCEHLIDACAQLAGSLLQGCERLRIVATSREPLDITGEMTRRVTGLSVAELSRPTTADRLRESEAVQLFVERAAATQPEFGLTEQNASAVAQVCRRLDGIPLAIELAAAWLGALAPEQIAERLDDALGLLTRSGRDLPGRQRSMQATLDWSYGRLDRQEQRVFDRLSVFAGGWTLEAAEAVSVGGLIKPGDVLPTLAGLADKSLVIVEQQPANVRYRLLETVRQYGWLRLTERNELAQVRDRHRDWCLELAEQAEHFLWGSEQTAWLSRLERDNDNLRASLEWSETGTGHAEAGLRLAAALWRFWDMRGYLAEGRRWLEGLLACPETQAPTRERAKALRALGYLAMLQGDTEQAFEILADNVDRWRRLGDQADLAHSLLFLGIFVGWVRGQPQAAVPLLTECLTLARSGGPPFVVYLALMRLGEIATNDSEYARAEALIRESYTLAHAAGDDWGAAHALLCQGLLALRQDDMRGAAQPLLESLGLRRRIQDARGAVISIEALASVAALDHLPELAARLYGAMQAVRDTLGVPRFGPMRAAWERGMAEARRQLGEPAFDVAWTAGRTIELDDAAACALDLEVRLVE
jgi:non-specific serine/threonine protein kinase